MQRLVIGVFLLVASRPAFACSITVIETLKRTFQESDIVFVGRVTAFENYAATLDVMDSFKGPRQQQFVVAAPGVGSCDFSAFEVGKSYLVIAIRDGETLHANLGSHTTEVTPETRHTVDLVRKRAAWWRSPVSRVAPLRHLTLLWRELRYVMSGILRNVFRRNRT